MFDGLRIPGHDVLRVDVEDERDIQSTRPATHISEICHAGVAGRDAVKSRFNRSPARMLSPASRRLRHRRFLSRRHHAPHQRPGHLYRPNPMRGFARPQVLVVIITGCSCRTRMIDSAVCPSRRIWSMNAVIIGCGSRAFRRRESSLLSESRRLRANACSRSLGARSQRAIHWSDRSGLGHRSLLG